MTPSSSARQRDGLMASAIARRPEACLRAIIERPMGCGLCELATGRTTIVDSRISGARLLL